MSPAEDDPQRILIVDDEPAVREALQRSLAFEGYGTQVAVDGIDALAKAESYAPDLIVLDIQMPRMDGLTAARRIRSTGATTPILMLTARDTVGDRVTGLDAGADDYLVKPFELDELFARIRALLRRSSYAAAAGGDVPDDNVLSFADLRMDLATREVTRGSRRVDLTRTEFTLLEMFLAHPRQVLTREQILKAVWGFDFEPSSNSLDVYVMYLRRKTEAGGEPRLVHTVRGVGYALRAAGVTGDGPVAVVPRAAPADPAGDAGGDGGRGRGRGGRGFLLVRDEGAAGRADGRLAAQVQGRQQLPGKLVRLLPGRHPAAAPAVLGRVHRSAHRLPGHRVHRPQDFAAPGELRRHRGDRRGAGLRPALGHGRERDEDARLHLPAGAARSAPGDTTGHIAVSIARPTSEVDDPLSTLAWVLLIVSGIGVVGAGAAGLWVARAGLRPVDELADTVEHVARTEDLTLRIPVEGEDEIARLSHSFNSMTAALATSRDRQAQLIADAGHELRTPLTSLRTNVELLARSEETGRPIPPDDRRALMKSVTAQMTELASLIGDLQELARPDAAQPGPLQVVGLHDIASAALERARLRGPELTITADLEPWYVRAEPGDWSGRSSTSSTTP